MFLHLKTGSATKKCAQSHKNEYFDLYVMYDQRKEKVCMDLL